MHLFLLTCLLLGCKAEISKETEKLVNDWAPLIWIHPEDPFYPSNVDYHLANMEVTLKAWKILSSYHLKLLAALLTNYFIVTIFNIKVRDKVETLIQSHPNVSSIVYGPGTSDYHLNTFVDIECVHCYRPHFYGQPLEEVGLKNFTGLEFFWFNFYWGCYW